MLVIEVLVHLHLAIEIVAKLIIIARVLQTIVVAQPKHAAVPAAAAEADQADGSRCKADAAAAAATTWTAAAARATAAAACWVWKGVASGVEHGTVVDQTGECAPRRPRRGQCCCLREHLIERSLHALGQLVLLRKRIREHRNAHVHLCEALFEFATRHVFTLVVGSAAAHHRKLHTWRLVNCWQHRNRACNIGNACRHS